MRPGGLGVVYLELDVGGDPVSIIIQNWAHSRERGRGGLPFGLDWAEVISEDLEYCECVTLVVKLSDSYLCTG